MGIAALEAAGAMSATSIKRATWQRFAHRPGAIARIRAKLCDILCMLPFPQSHPTGRYVIDDWFASSSERVKLLLSFFNASNN